MKCPFAGSRKCNEQESPPAWKRKRRTAHGLTFPRRVPLSCWERGYPVQGVLLILSGSTLSCLGVPQSCLGVPVSVVTPLPPPMGPGTRLADWSTPPPPQNEAWDQRLGYLPLLSVNKQTENNTFPRTWYAGGNNVEKYTICCLHRNQLSG